MISLLPARHIIQSVLAVLDRARYFSVTDAPLNTDILPLGLLDPKGCCCPFQAPPSPGLPHSLLAATPSWCNRLNSYKHLTPPGTFFYPRSLVIGQAQRCKKNFVNAITWKIIIGSVLFFTWSHQVTHEYRDHLIRFSTDNQNGCHLATNFFFT